MLHERSVNHELVEMRSEVISDFIPARRSPTPKKVWYGTGRTNLENYITTTQVAVPLYRVLAQSSENIFSGLRAETRLSLACRRREDCKVRKSLPEMVGGAKEDTMKTMIVWTRRSPGARETGDNTAFFYYQDAGRGANLAGVWTKVAFGGRLSFGSGSGSGTPLPERIERAIRAQAACLHGWHESYEDDCPSCREAEGVMPVWPDFTPEELQAATA